MYLAALDELVEVGAELAAGVSLLLELLPLLRVFLLDGFDHLPDVILLFLCTFGASCLDRFGECLWNYIVER